MYQLYNAKKKKKKILEVLIGAGKIKWLTDVLMEENEL